MDRFEFTRIFCERPRSFAWFLGAGASRNANLPTAEDIITDLKRRYYCAEENQEYSTKDMQNDAIRESVEAFLQGRGFPERWAPEEYTTYFDKIFGDDRQRQRAYIQGMLSEERVKLSVGNRVFGALMASGLTRAAFTTNFDSVVEKSVAQIGGASLSSFHLEGAQNANAALNNEDYPFYCKLHGDFRYDSIKNLEADLATQNKDISQSLVNAMNRFGLIVAGYSGRDASVMALLNEALESQNPYPHGIYWLKIKGSPTPSPVESFIEEAHNRNVTAEVIEIDTFDTLMLRLWRSLTERPEEMDKLVRKGCSEEVSIPIHEQAGSTPLMRFNALPIITVPKTCLSVELSEKPTWEKIGPILREGGKDVIVTISDELHAWGDAEDMKDIFGNKFVSSSHHEFEPDWRKSGLLSTKRFLEDAIGRSFTNCRPLLMRRRGSGVVLIVDKMAQDVGVFEPLYNAIGKTTGIVHGLTIPATEEHEAINKVEFAESLHVSLAWGDDRLWMLLKPDVWIWPPYARRHARDWLSNRKSDRRNYKFDELLTAWISVLSDGAGKAEEVTITAFDAKPSSSNPSFTFSTRTGYSNKRGNA